MGNSESGSFDENDISGILSTNSDKKKIINTSGINIPEHLPNMRPQKLWISAPPSPPNPPVPPIPQAALPPEPRPIPHNLAPVNGCY